MKPTDKQMTVARAICQEKCAFMGEPACWQVDGHKGELSPSCDEPGCLAEAFAALDAIRAASLPAAVDGWQPMDSAPKDGTEILVRRFNDCFHEHDVVWWSGCGQYPWATNSGGGYPEDRPDEWQPIPNGSAAS
jgi:hypothetical protein